MCTFTRRFRVLYHRRLHLNGAATGQQRAIGLAGRGTSHFGWCFSISGFGALRRSVGGVGRPSRLARVRASPSAANSASARITREESPMYGSVSAHGCDPRGRRFTLGSPDHAQTLNSHWGDRRGDAFSNRIDTLRASLSGIDGLNDSSLLDAGDRGRFAIATHCHVDVSGKRNDDNHGDAQEHSALHLNSYAITATCHGSLIGYSVSSSVTVAAGASTKCLSPSRRGRWARMEPWSFVRPIRPTEDQISILTSRVVAPGWVETDQQRRPVPSVQAMGLWAAIYSNLGRSDVELP